MAAAARRRVVEQFSWQSIARQTRAFYDELLQQPRRGSDTRMPAG
jgi:glycosyltransferase involved in cell wall biosynthesis